MSTDEDGQKLYGEHFYDWQVSGSLQSARILTKHLSCLYHPLSVLDLGCGRGAWLKAWGECGTMVLVGMDGTWNSQKDMIDPRIEFRSANLAGPISIDRKFDLAMSVEVAEHVPRSAADSLVDALVSASPVVLFGAAYLLQGGTGHINEQLPSYWAKKFAARGYAAFDLFRPTLWSNPQIEWWYLQNAFLYTDRNSPQFTRLRGQGFVEVGDLSFLDIRHPIADTVMRKLKPWARAKLKKYSPAFLWRDRDAVSSP